MRIFNNFIEFDIKDKFTGEVKHSFSISYDADEYIANTNSTQSYTWFFGDEDIIGDLIITGRLNYTNPVTLDLGERIQTYQLTNEVEFNISPIYLQRGCTDINAVNFNPTATTDDGSCKFETDCSDKYVGEKIRQIAINNIIVNQGFNILSYPFELSSLTGLNFFEVLTSSYRKVGDSIPGGFSEGDYIMTYFNNKLYSASFIDGEWKSTSAEGFSLQTAESGMGLIIHLNNPGTIAWTMPRV
jgi:hypothetical protein